MVAYSFQREFIDPTHSGRKIHTIRAVGKRRHARPGDKVQHYVGMRTRQCRLFARSVCEKTLPIVIRFNAKTKDDWVRIDGGRPIVLSALDEFANYDGFTNWAALRAFWMKKHDKPTRFAGVIIYWKNMEAVV